MRSLGWVVGVVGVLSIATAGGPVQHPPTPENAPPLARPSLADPIIRLRVVVDEALVRQHGDALESFLSEAVAIHNVEWRRVRHEWFVLDEIVAEAGSGSRDALYQLATLVHQTVQVPGVIHIRVTGQPLEIYGSGVSRAVGGLAFRGSDALVVSATPGVAADLLAYYLFHEIGHCFDAFDLPFGGGNSTFGHKQFATFDVDAGNSQIMEDSPGPRPRDTPRLAPAVIRSRLATARGNVQDARVYRELHDLLLHDASPANPEYRRKRDSLLASAGTDRGGVLRVLRKYELTPQHARADAAARRDMSEQYWIANDAIKRGDVATAEAALACIESLHQSDHGDTSLLVSAVGKKIRRRR